MGGKLKAALALHPVSLSLLLRKSALFFVGSLFAAAVCLGQSDSLTLVPYAKRVQFKQKFEPNAVLIGAGQSEIKFTQAFAKAVGRKPAMHMDYAGLESFNNGGRRADSITKHLRSIGWNCALQLGLGMTTDGKPDRHYEHKVAEGKYDAEIANLITFFKKLDRSVYLRLGYEFNGEWNGYKPDTYIAAYKRIADAIRAAKCTNVALIWCFSPDGTNHDFMKYYPGDAYVDWWAIDIFGQAHFAHPAMLSFSDSSLAHKRPLMIGESTARKTNLAETEKALKRWFVPYFNFIRSRPNVKAFCYINYDWAPTFLPDWGDARVEINPAINAWVKKEVANKFYLEAKR